MMRKCEGLREHAGASAGKQTKTCTEASKRSRMRGCHRAHACERAAALCSRMWKDHCRSSKCSRASLRTQPKGAPIVPSVAQQCSKVPKVCALLEMVPSHDSKQVRCAASTWSFGNVALCIRIPRGLKRILLAFLDTDGGPTADQGGHEMPRLARRTQKGPRESNLAGSFGG